MTIYPSLVDSTGHVHEYSSSPVYTTVDGAKAYVSDGYAATTREEVMRLALRNAEVRRAVAKLASDKTIQ